MSDDSTLAAIFGDRVQEEYEDELLNPEYYKPLKYRRPFSPMSPNSVEYPEVENVYDS